MVTLGLIVLANLILGFLILAERRSSLTSQFFLGFVVANSLWSLVNYVAAQGGGYPLSLIMSYRLVLFFAILQSLFFFLLMLVFPSDKQRFPRWIKFGIIPASVGVMLLTLTSAMFSGISRTGEPVEGWGMALFGTLSVFLVTCGFVFLVRKIRKASKKDKLRFKPLLYGAGIMFTFIILFNFVSPTIFDNSSFVIWGPAYILPFLILTAYGIFKHHLFNIKVFVTQGIVFMVWIFLLVRTLLYTNTVDLVIGSVLFILMVGAGVLLIKSVRKEIKQREQLEKLSVQLAKANEKLQEIDQMKTEFLSLASHQLRTPLTAIKGYSSMILEGNFGRVSKKASEPIEKIFQSSVTLAEVIADLLDVSKIEQGGMKYEMRTFSLVPVVQSVVDEQKLAAKDKGLKLDFHVDGGHKYAVKGDKLKLRQIIQNLIDNAIKYTPKGSVNVSLAYTKDRHVRFEVADTGLGISKAGIEKLFEKFSRGKSGKANTSGSGLGLYLVKQIVKAHAGKVWVESPGEGKGATFIVELPTLYN